ncbi:MAG: hypothetical protein ACOYMA_14640 [Bacteroidia bacterium]
MKNTLILFFLFFRATLFNPLQAQDDKIVTLVVSGQGKTQEDAKITALRSAIEQAFGVFVSANTTILNDSLVKDEIATVSSGNIKKYEEIASLILPNGNISLTLKVTVSISKLIKYAESHDSSVEFAGATFGANMKLKDLNKSNEEKAIENMKSQLIALAPLMFDYRLEMGEPKMSQDGEVYIIDAKVFVNYNANTENSNSILLKTLSSLSLNTEDVEEYKTLNLPNYIIDVGNFYFQKSQDKYIPKIVQFKKTVIDENAYCNTNFLRKYIKEKIDLDFENLHRISSDLTYYFRSQNTEKQLGELINIIFSKGVFNFNIKDNQGQSSMIERSTIIIKDKIKQSSRNEVFDVNNNGCESYQYLGIISLSTQPIVGFKVLKGWLYTDRSYQDDFGFKRNIYSGSIAIPHLFKDKLAKKDDLPVCYVIEVKMNIPKEDISKYTKFTIERK